MEVFEDLFDELEKKNIDPFAEWKKKDETENDPTPSNDGVGDTKNEDDNIEEVI